MTDPLFSSSWYRVKDLKPRLRRHVEIHRHDYRGRIWYILQDHASGRSHRLSPAGYRLVALMDGTRSIDELWDLINQKAGDEAPTQDEIIRLLGQLHAADALICDVPPDGLELFRRFRRHERRRLRQRLWSPLAVRFPLIDPERFLDWSLPAARPFFTWYGAVLWLAIVGAGAIMAGLYWTDLTENIIDRALTPQNLVLLWVTYPVVKALHELGHGYATKIAGGEVHEMGIMLLVLIPVPYVDASSAQGFRDKSSRMLVGAIGIAVELFLGSLALFVWVNAQPGPVHSVAFNIMLISGVSTLLFNGNPLLRFDGYYVLADLLEIPNLGTRANKYLGYLIQRYLFGSRDAESPADTPGEKFWFVTYGIAAFIYRIFIMFVIIVYIGSQFFIVGVALAIWALITQAFVPLGKNMKFLFTNPKLRRNRGRALGMTAALIGAVGVGLFVVPAPFWIRAEGVTWPSEKSRVRAETDGFIKKVLVGSSAQVQSRQSLVEIEDPFLEARVEVLRAQLKGLKRQLISAMTSDRVQAAVLREEVGALKADLARARELTDALVIQSPRSGVLFVPNEQDLPGRFIRKGQLVAYVVHPSDELTARVVVTQEQISLVRRRTRIVEIMPAHWGAKNYRAEILRQVPGGTRQLPARALGSAGGGAFAVDPSDSQGLRTLERVFEIEVNIPQDARTGYLGQRIFVKFDLGYEPFGFQIYRALNQLFLRMFDV
jgi:putative peptide zinc metalloprotease protein